MRNNALIFIIVAGIFILLLLTGGATMVLRAIRGTGSGVVTTSPSASSTVNPNGCTLEAKICPDGSSVGREGSNCEFAPCPSPQSGSPLPSGIQRYEDPQGAYTFTYSSTYTLDAQNEGEQVRITRLGPTQQGQTEIYDGVVMVFEAVDLGSTPLTAWVDKRIAESTNDGTVEVTKKKTKTTLGKYDGFQYTTRGLGEFTNYVIQKDTTSTKALEITVLQTDPQKIGFDLEVQEVLASIDLL